MTIVEKLKAYFTKKRSLKFIVGGIALALAGHLLEGIPVISSLQGMTVWVEISLRAIQPFQIADAFFDATRGHSGLWFCAPVGSFPDAEDHCGSIFGLANIGLASAFALPGVTGEVWRNGGLISTALFLMTILGMALLIIGGWSDIDKPDGGLGKAVLGTIMVLAMGPLAAGAVFWLLLQFLLLLVVIFGKALAGIAWCVATFGTAYKVCAAVFGAVETGDKLQERTELLTGGDKNPKA